MITCSGAVELDRLSLAESKTIQRLVTCVFNLSHRIHNLYARCVLRLQHWLFPSCRVLEATAQLYVNNPKLCAMLLSQTNNPRISSSTFPLKQNTLAAVNTHQSDLRTDEHVGHLFSSPWRDGVIYSPGCYWGGLCSDATVLSPTGASVDSSARNAETPTATDQSQRCSERPSPAPRAHKLEVLISWWMLARRVSLIQGSRFNTVSRRLKYFQDWISDSTQIIFSYVKGDNCDICILC